MINFQYDDERVYLKVLSVDRYLSALIWTIKTSSITRVYGKYLFYLIFSIRKYMWRLQIHVFVKRSKVYYEIFIRSVIRNVPLLTVKYLCYLNCISYAVNSIRLLRTIDKQDTDNTLLAVKHFNDLYYL